MAKYYRVAEIDRDQTQDTSIHVPLPIEDLLGQYYQDQEWEELAYYAEKDEQIEALEKHLDDYLFYQEDGHEGEGLYLNGVCAVETLEALDDYFLARGGYPTGDGRAIFEIEGDYIDTLLDCELVAVESFKLIKSL